MFLDISGHRLDPPDDAVVELVMAVADGSLREVEKISAGLAPWTV